MTTSPRPVWKGLDAGRMPVFLGYDQTERMIAALLDRAAAWRRRFASLGGFRACREANSLRAFFGQKCDTFTICPMSLFALDVFQLDIVSMTWLRRVRASARELYLAHGIFTAQLMRVTVHGQIGY